MAEIPQILDLLPQQLAAPQQLRTQPNVLLQNIAIGEILSLVVNSNPPERNITGSLLLNGQLIQAFLPASLKEGDRVLAQIIEKGEQIKLQLLESLPSTRIPLGAPSSLAGIEKKLSNEIQEIFRTLDKNSHPVSSATTVVELDSTPPLLQPVVNELIKIVWAADSKEQPTSILQVIQKIEDGNIPGEMKKLANLVKEFLSPTDFKTEQIINQIKEQIRTILEDTQSGSPRTTEQINRLVTSIEQELVSNSSNLNKRAKEQLRNMVHDLKLSVEVPESAKQVLNQIHEQFSLGLDKETKTGSPQQAKNLTDLQAVANRLEQAANLQDSLNRINPMMQAVQEPILILFPVVMQNMLLNAEIKFETDKNNSRGQKKRKDKGYTKVTINLPLPALGPLQIKIAWKKPELYAQITSPTEEVCQFLQTKRDVLSTLLGEQQIRLTDYVVFQGDPAPLIPNKRAHSLIA